MPADTPATPARRTRLTPERERELFTAVVDLVREQGYDALTMDAVAARTKSSKATLYRQWESKPKLVATALRHLADKIPTDVDTGSLVGDLRHMVDTFIDQATEDTALLNGLAHAVSKDEELWQALYELHIRPGLEALDTVLQRGIERGELSPDNPAKEFVPHLIFGAFSTRKLIENRTADAEYMQRYLTAVVFPALGVSDWPTA
ncbi:TetR/AcrR family transcriptional regulator [Saccharomonospora viridis]|uniref:Transcriptional regulator, tetR family n=2 Tax=Saccharomonospora viridis TaxID=1852 RepID=C7MYJ6_SACVD|nr:TetR/AcrR family transcriptional regulator [Saccharomonospora viridis]ACU97415.1 transcriptional regulator, tetR family [Saccharomonospora viridis DSM 43017]KHF43756.1 TetR family transcriptional regulator [Saccharomonospora viridis]SFP84549.1 transcriptional regulator, TetR family [Saccharomonospora viridis]